MYFISIIIASLVTFDIVRGQTPTATPTATPTYFPTGQPTGMPTR